MAPFPKYNSTPEREAEFKRWLDTQVGDDLDPRHIADERVSFGLDGDSYQMNLTNEHAAELRAALAEYITAARVIRDDGLDLPLPVKTWPLEF